MRLTRAAAKIPNVAPAAPPRYSEGRAWVRVRGAFFPDLIEARPGERLRLVFRREETAACSERVLLPSLGKSVMLPPFEDVTLDLGPLPPGDYEFRCQLGVLRGLIRVRAQAAHPSVDVVRGRIVIRSGRRRGSVGSTGTKAALAPDGWAGRESSQSDEETRRGRGRPIKRPPINITPSERLGRVLMGLVGVIGGLILLASSAGMFVAVLEVLLVLAGLDLIVTGALGHCPLYRGLGYLPPSLRRPA